ncbi:MAG: hypothetical protein ACREI2_07715 [Nitrospiraceae bacterium]
MREQRKWQAVLGLGLVWVALIVMRVTTEEEPKQVPLKFQSGLAVAKSIEAESENGQIVVKPIRTKAHQSPVMPKKNIFAPFEPPRLPTTVAKSKTLKQANAPDPQPAATPVAPSPPSPEELAAQQARRQQEVLRQQMAQYRYLGYLSQGGEERAFLGKGREIYIIRMGDTLEGRFQVASIDAKAVKLRETRTNLETLIQLTKEGSGGSS